MALKLEEKQLENCRTIIVSYLKNLLEESGCKGFVVALSGGLDSATVLKLASEAAPNVVALIMPEKGITKAADVKDAKSLVKSLGIKHEKIEINPFLKCIDKSFPWEKFSKENTKLSKANVKPRTRMLLTYLAANLNNYLVLGTGNRTEILLGYSTKFGDSAADALPIGALYKSQVRQLASQMGIPKTIIEKTPSAGLWKGQTDESELGATYEEMDSILECIADRRMSHGAAAKELGIELEKVKKVASRMAKTGHKRKATPIVEFQNPT